MHIVKLSIISVSLLLASCSQPSSEASADSPSQTGTATALPAYTVTEVERHPERSKVNITVLLPEKLTEAQLRQVAQKIKADNSGYDKTWISYYLKGMKVGSGAWATTHFIPELEVAILGASQAQEEAANQQAAAVKEPAVGRWYEEQYAHASYVIYQKGSAYLVKTTFDNGQTDEQPLLRKGNTFTYKGGGFNGEYFKILPDGRLGMYNQEGKQFTVANTVE